MSLNPQEPSVDEPKKTIEDLRGGLIDDCKEVLVTLEQKVELDRRLRAYERDKNRGRLANDALAEVRDRL